MAKRTQAIPDIYRDLDEMPSNTLYHYLHADGTLKEPGGASLGNSTATIGSGGTQ